jgi:hypothetical protein
MREIVNTDVLKAAAAATLDGLTCRATWSWRAFWCAYSLPEDRRTTKLRACHRSDTAMRVSMHVFTYGSLTYRPVWEHVLTAAYPSCIGIIHGYTSRRILVAAYPALINTDIARR